MPLKKVADFTVSYMQILDEKGNLDEKLEPKLEKDKLIQIYRDMTLAREIDQRMLKMQRQGRIGTFGPCTGQEAITVASAHAMKEKDWMVTAFRELGGRLVRGEKTYMPFLFHNGFEEGNLSARDLRLLPINIIVGSQTLHAVGLAYAMKYRGEKDSAVVTFLGDGGTSQGDFYEAMNFAGVWEVPVVFIIQNNGWAISIPRSHQTKAQTLAQKAISAGLPAIQVDGNDALAVFKAVSEALERAHKGQGASVIEAITYRLMMHTTSDDPTKYRKDEEVQEMWKKEPLIRFKLYLEKKGIWDAKAQEKLEGEIKIEVENAVKDFEGRKDFKPDANFDYVFGTKHESIEEQRKEFCDSLLKEMNNG
jgi:pyruvate dehydrogenase E1 component alpha subunit